MLSMNVPTPYTVLVKPTKQLFVEMGKQFDSRPQVLSFAESLPEDPTRVCFTTRQIFLRLEHNLGWKSHNQYKLYAAKLQKAPLITYYTHIRGYDWYRHNCSACCFPNTPPSRSWSLRITQEKILFLKMLSTWWVVAFQGDDISGCSLQMQTLCRNFCSQFMSKVLEDELANQVKLYVHYHRVQYNAFV